MSSKKPPSATPFVSVSPLWTRAPLRDEQGNSYFDFMMLIPRLKQQNAAGIELTVHKIRTSLARFENQVVYIDLNPRLNLLWISIKPVPELTRLMVNAIREAIPEARVVAGDFNPETARSRQRLPLLGRVTRKLVRKLGRSG